jgi:parvulin-like peptidyl-prolyl isomerase
VLWLGLCAFWLVACGRKTPTSVPDTTRVTGVVAPTLPLPAATASLTPEPLAASVNGEAIPLAAYEVEVRRCEAGLSAGGRDPAQCPALALQGLIEQKAVEQAARAAGLTVADQELEVALASIIQDLGGPEAYAAWLTANLYTDESYREALRRDRLRARMIDQATAYVGDVAEQVHARELLVADEALAQGLLSQLQSGADFATLAVTHSLDLSSRPAGGDLGWFPRGLLSVPEVEQAAFALQPGETSGVIHSGLGYHIVQTLERDPARPLTPVAEQVLRENAYAAWLESVLARATVEKFVQP